MIRKIVEKGDAVLAKKCHPVTKFDQKLALLLDDMRETLLESGGVGLAAPQVGILRRAVLVINDEDEIYELINPTIVSTSGEQTDFEGCLSLPGRYGVVTRPMRVRVRAQDRTGEWYEVEDEGLTARCFCHELDHLDGIVYTEVMDRFLTDEEIEAL